MKVAFIDTVHSALEIRLKSKGIDCHHLITESRDQLKSVIGTYDGIIIRSRIQLDADFLQEAKSLKFIARSGAGMENIDLKFCEEKKIICFNSPEGNRTAVAEHALGMLLMLMNRLKICDAEVRKGLWRRDENRGYELEEKTIGIIGYGQMGSAFAQRLTGFGCKILAHDKYKTGFGNQFVKEVSLEEIQRECYIVSLHLPLSDETKYYVNNEFISKMKNSFYLINTARGQNVNTAALVEGIKNKKILGACLDVLEYEKTSFENLEIASMPEPMQYLVNSDKVILSPHVAGWTHESYEKLSVYLAEKIIEKFAL